MKIDEWASADAHTAGGGETPPSAGLAPNALPEVQGQDAEDSQTGVSTRNAPLPTSHKESRPLDFNPKDINLKESNPKDAISKDSSSKDEPHWYALRTTYGREKRASDYMAAKKITVFYPTKQVVKLVDGKRKEITVSRLPNIFFAYGTEEELKTFVYDNVNLPYLRFYYQHKHVGRMIRKTPLIVPDKQMESLRIICEAEANDTIVSLVALPKFEAGQLVRVVDGAFAGVIGKVARWQGQQRVAVIIGDLVTVVTAYVPSAFLEKLPNNN